MKPLVTLRSSAAAVAGSLAVAALSACGAQPEAAPPAPAPSAEADTPAPTPAAEPANDGAVGAPLIEGVTWRLGADRAGSLVELAPGDRFQVELLGVPTAGYVWSAVEVPAFIRAAGEANGPTHAAQSEPGFTGGNHWEVFAFDVIGEGDSAVRFAQARPWETNEPAADTFEFTLRARIPR